MDFDGNILCSVSGREYTFDYDTRMRDGMITIEYKGQPVYMDAYGNIIADAEWIMRYWFS